jgi:hypothetical protein
MFDTIEACLDVVQKGTVYLDRGMDNLLLEQSRDQGMESLKGFYKARKKAAKLLGKDETSQEVKDFLSSIGYK